MQMKKYLYQLLALVLIFSLFPIQTKAAGYHDAESHWANSAIQKWSDAGVINGADELFRPDAPVTRGEMAVILDQCMKYQTISENQFSDLDQNYYTDAILRAHSAGIIKDSNNLIHPRGMITREDAAVMLALALNIPESNTAVSFADASEISAPAKGFVSAMAERKIINGSDGRFNPKAYITRAEVVTILHKGIQGFYNQPGEYTGDIDGTVVVNTSDVVLKNMKIAGDLIIAEGVGEGTVTLDSVVVSGETFVKGGGPNSVDVTGTSDLGKVTVTKNAEGTVSVKVAGSAKVSIIIALDGSVMISGTVGSLDIAGNVTVTAFEANIENINIASPNASLTIDKGSQVSNLNVMTSNAQIAIAGTVTNIAADLNAGGTVIEIAAGGIVTALNTESPININNNGTIAQAAINADGVIIAGVKPSDMVVGSTVTQMPRDASGTVISNNITTPSINSNDEQSSGSNNNSNNNNNNNNNGNDDPNLPPVLSDNTDIQTISSPVNVVSVDTSSAIIIVQSNTSVAQLLADITSNHNASIIVQKYLSDAWIEETDTNAAVASTSGNDGHRIHVVAEDTTSSKDYSITVQSASSLTVLANQIAPTLSHGQVGLTISNYTVSNYVYMALQTSISAPEIDGTINGADYEPIYPDNDGKAVVTRPAGSYYVAEIDSQSNVSQTAQVTITNCHIAYVFNVTNNSVGTGISVNGFGLAATANAAPASFTNLDTAIPVGESRSIVISKQNYYDNPYVVFKGTKDSTDLTYDAVLIAPNISLDQTIFATARYEGTDYYCSLDELMDIVNPAADSDHPAVVTVLKNSTLTKGVAEYVTLDIQANATVTLPADYNQIYAGRVQLADDTSFLGITRGATINGETGFATNINVSDVANPTYISLNMPGTVGRINGKTLTGQTPTVTGGVLGVERNVPYMLVSSYPHSRYITLSKEKVVLLANYEHRTNYTTENTRHYTSVGAASTVILNNDYIHMITYYLIDDATLAEGDTFTVDAYYDSIFIADGKTLTVDGNLVINGKLRFITNSGRIIINGQINGLHLPQAPRADSVFVANSAYDTITLPTAGLIITATAAEADKGTLDENTSTVGLTSYATAFNHLTTNTCHYYIYTKGSDGYLEVLGFARENAANTVVTKLGEKPRYFNTTEAAFNMVGGEATGYTVKFLGTATEIKSTSVVSAGNTLDLDGTTLIIPAYAEYTGHLTFEEGAKLLVNGGKVKFESPYHSTENLRFLNGSYIDDLQIINGVKLGVDALSPVTIGCVGFEDLGFDVQASASFSQLFNPLNFNLELYLSFDIIVNSDSIPTTPNVYFKSVP